MAILDLMVSKAHAAANFQLNDFNFLTIWKGTGDQNKAMGDIITKIIGLVLVVAGLVAFLYLVMAGFQYLTAGGDAAKATTARQGIINAIIGILIIVIAFVLVSYVGNAISGP